MNRAAVVLALSLVIPSIARGATRATEPTQSIAGKKSMITSFKIEKDSDGEFNLRGTSADGEGFNIVLGPAVKQGKKLESGRVMTYVRGADGGLSSRGGTASSTVLLSAWKPGTYEKPGKCSGTFTVTSEFLGEIYQASGSFTDVTCTRD